MERDWEGVGVMGREWRVMITLDSKWGGVLGEWPLQGIEGGDMDHAHMHVHIYPRRCVGVEG